MRRLTIAGILLLCLTLVNATACNPFGGEEEVTEHLVEVVRGDLTVSVSGSGNIEVSNEIKLAFGVGGRVDKIHVHEGDQVSEGELLAQLETDSLELAVAQAEVAVTQAEVAVTQAEVAVTQAEINLENARIAVEQTQDLYTWSDIRIAQADVDAAEDYLEDSLEKLYQYMPLNEEGNYPDFLEFILGEDYPKGPGFEALQERIVHAQARLNTAENRLEAMLSGFDADVVAVKKQQVEAAQQSLELAQQTLTLNEQSLRLAQQSLKQAQKQLDEATVIALFDGVVANVYAEEGDIIPSPSMGPKTIIHLIDPGSMQLKVQVDEIDVAEVKPGQKAIIEVDALPALPLEGTVSFISLLPETEGGVIVYDVEITFDVAEGIGIRAGMSATADITIAERSNVLLVPDRAVKQDSQGNNMVEVMIDEQIEERVVVIGISDGYQTEILAGLEEGEMVERRAKP